jgi:pimeloyl-ACP methyl ester carboxylesterase
MASFEVEAFAPTVHVPVLVVHDTDDREVPYDDGRRLAEVFGASLLTTNGLGHRRILFAPDVVTAVVEFIEQGRQVGAIHDSAMEQR